MNDILTWWPLYSWLAVLVVVLLYFRYRSRRSVHDLRHAGKGGWLVIMAMFVACAGTLVSVITDGASSPTGQNAATTTKEVQKHKQAVSRKPTAKPPKTEEPEVLGLAAVVGQTIGKTAVTFKALIAAEALEVKRAHQAKLKKMRAEKARLARAKARERARRQAAAASRPSRPVVVSQPTTPPPPPPPVYHAPVATPPPPAPKPKPKFLLPPCCGP